MTNIPFQNIDIKTLIPQRPPFVLIDKLLFADLTKAISSWKIEPTSLFVDNNILSPSAVLENIAQTAAAHLGYINIYSNENQEVKIGLVGAVSNLEIFDSIYVNDILTTEVQILEQIADLKLISAKVTRNNDLLATAEMKIALTNISVTL